MEENTTFEEVYSEFLSQISTYEYLNYDESELKEEFLTFLKRSMSKFITKDFYMDELLEEFSRPLLDIEITILGLGMLEAWLSPKINNQLLLKQQLSSKDFTFFSGANHLKELQSLKKEISNDFHYYLQRYELHRFTSKEGGKR